MEHTDQEGGVGCRGEGTPGHRSDTRYGSTDPEPSPCPLPSPSLPSLPSSQSSPVWVEVLILL